MSYTKDMNTKKPTVKEKRLADAKLDGKTHIEAYKEGYNPPTTTKTSTMVGNTSKILNRAHIKSYLEEHSKDMESVLIKTVNRYKDSEDLNEVKEATTNARWIHDKIHGKATQITEVNSQSVSLNIDLTGNGLPTLDS